MEGDDGPVQEQLGRVFGDNGGLERRPCTHALPQPAPDATPDAGRGVRSASFRENPPELNASSATPQPHRRAGTTRPWTGILPSPERARTDESAISCRAHRQPAAPAAIAA